MFIRRIFSLAFTAVCCAAFCGASGSCSTLLTDEELFEELNLDYPGLEAVKVSVSKGDYNAAKKAFVFHLRNRTSPKWFVDWHDYTKPVAEKNAKKSVTVIYADRITNNELIAHGSWHKYGDKIDWTADYSYDDYDEWVWQLNRHSCWVNLAEAYWETGDEKYPKAFVRQLNEWIDDNKIPTIGWNGKGSVWRTLDAGLRMQGNWPNLLYRFLASPSFDDETIIKMVKSFYEHATHLCSHNTSNNWLAVEMSGLYTVGALFPEFKNADDWRSFAASMLYEQEKEQFYPDGAQVELAPGYHALSTSSIVDVYKLARLNGYSLPKGYVERLESAYEYYVKLMLPDRTLPALNDSEWLECKKYIEEASELFPDRKDFKYFATDGDEGKKPSYTSVWMPWAGWYVMRSSWDKDAFYALFEVGPYGAAHQHEDKLSFVLYAYGNRIITECGTYSYDRSDFRKYTLSARGHNVARVDGMDQNRNSLRNVDTIIKSPKPLDNLWKTTEKYDLGEGCYNEGFGSNNDNTVTHKRKLRFLKNKYWILTDTFTPSDKEFHTYDIWFHFNTPSYSIDKELGVVSSNAVDSANIVIIPIGHKNMADVILGQEESEIQGWMPVHGGGNGYCCVPAATPTFHFEGQGEQTISFILFPLRPSEKIVISKIKQISNDSYYIYIQEKQGFKVKL